MLGKGKGQRGKGKGEGKGEENTNLLSVLLIDIHQRTDVREHLPFTLSPLPLPPFPFADICFVLNRQAAVDLNHLAGDIPGVVGKQEAGNACNFIRFGKTAQRNLFDDLCAIGLIESSRHIG